GLRLRWQARRLASARARSCVYPLTSAPAAAIALDKGFANTYLSHHAIPNLGGRHFFLHERHRRLRGPGHELADAHRLLDQMGHVGFVKPLAGSHGDFAEIVGSRREFDDYVARVAKFHDAIIVQKVFCGDEYRVFLIDGEVMFCSFKSVPKLAGDGASTLAALLDRHAAALAGSGVSAPPANAVYVDASGVRYGAADVVPAGTVVPLRGRANFSAGGAGTLVDQTAVPPRVLELAKAAARALGLRVAGVDLFVDRADVRVI